MAILLWRQGVSQSELGKSVTEQSGALMSTTSSMKMETDQVGFVSQNRGRLADLSRTLMSTTSSMRMEVVV